ncbi:hypothetical protein [Lentimicrobium sp.]|uniref:hypothetical protein n=1 Tax=Lentimicrobium sp. TaxID=2034841 RepID=UPI00345EE9F0
MKKIWIILLSVVLLAGLIAAGLGLRSYYLFLKQPVAPIFNAVPENAVVFVKSGSIADFMEKTRSSGLIDILENTETNTGFHNLSSWVDSAGRQDDYLRKLIAENEFLISFSPDSLGSPVFLLAIKVGKIRSGTLRHHLSNMAEKSGYVITSVKHQPAALFRISGESGESWYFSYRGLFVISPDRTLLEQSMEAIHNLAPAAKDPALAKLTGTAGKRVDGVLFFRNDLLFSHLTGSDKNPFLIKNSPFNGWSALDLSIRKEKLQLSGFTWNGDEASVLSRQTPAGPVDFSNFPSSAVAGFTLLMSDPAAYTKQFISGDTLHVTGYDTINSIPVKEVFRLNEHLWSWMGRSISYVSRTPDLQNINSSGMVLISSRNRDSAEIALRPFLQATGGTTEKLMASGLPLKLWGPWFDLKDPLYCYIGQDVVALSHSRDFLNTYAMEKEAMAGGVKKSPFVLLPNELSDKANILLYLKPHLLAKSIGNPQKKDRINPAAHWTSLLSGCDQLVMNFNAGSSLLYAQGSLHFKEDLPRTMQRAEISASGNNQSGLHKPDETKSGIQKKAEIPAVSKRQGKAVVFVSAPAIVDGEKPGEKLIAVFTAKNALEMYDAKGDFKWSFQCRGDISGDIYQADYQKNGQRHYLIFTESHMHILDRKGKEIKASPVTLPGKAGSAVALFDYDRKRDYRVIFGGHDNLIHNITLKGEPLPDWQKPRLSRLAGRAEFFRTGGRDYLAFTTGEGRLLITDRRGRERISIPANFRKSNRAELFENKTNSKGIFLTASEDGRLTYITEKGVISYSSFGDFGNHPWFHYTDFDGDGSYDFIFAGNDRISIFSRMKNAIATIDVKDGQLGKPFLYTALSGERWLAVRNKKSNRIILLSSRGSAKELDNLSSETDPVIFNPGGRRKEVLVTTSKGKLILTPIQ